MRDVYFVEARKLGLIKIGMSDNAVKRLADLQGASPDTLCLRATVQTNNARALEERFHRLFWAQRSHREWFKPSARLKQLIADLAHVAVEVTYGGNPYDLPAMTMPTRCDDDADEIARRFCDIAEALGHEIGRD
jgi:hypothetical protein